MYTLFFGPIIILAKVILTYFGFYLYAETHLKGSLPTAIGMLILAITHTGSQILFRIRPDFGSMHIDMRLIITSMNITGYLLFTIGFAIFAIEVVQRFKKS